VRLSRICIYDFSTALCRLTNIHFVAYDVLPFYYLDGSYAAMSSHHPVKEVADDVYAAYKRGNDIIYRKWFWKSIMFIIKSIPE
jgi:hypothetical protein